MNGAYGYWLGSLEAGRESLSDAELEVFEKGHLRFWEKLWKTES